MLRRNILKIIMTTSVATFTVLTHHNIDQQKFEFKKQQNIKLKTSEERYNNIYQKYIKPVKVKEARELAEKKRIEELKRKEESEWINLVCTFYTGDPSENGGFANTTASGKVLSRGMVASNSHKFGTKIYTKEFGTLTVEDVSNRKYIRKIDENTYRIDIYVPDKQTAERLGVKKIRGKIIK